MSDKNDFKFGRQQYKRELYFHNDTLFQKYLQTHSDLDFENVHDLELGADVTDVSPVVNFRKLTRLGLTMSKVPESVKLDLAQIRTLEVSAAGLRALEAQFQEELKFDSFVAQGFKNSANLLTALSWTALSLTLAAPPISLDECQILQEVQGAKIFSSRSDIDVSFLRYCKGLTYLQLNGLTGVVSGLDVCSSLTELRELALSGLSTFENFEWLLHIGNLSSILLLDMPNLPNDLLGALQQKGIVLTYW